MLSSYCRNCGVPNSTTSEMSANHCNGCEETRTAAMQHAKEKNPNASASELLYAGREALIGRAHSSRAGAISPRDFNRADMERR